MSTEKKKTIGVLLVNLGTPDAPTPSAVRRYLAEFLRDRRVVEIPRLIWLPILYGVILPFRPRPVAHKYASIWRDDGSPLLAIAHLQAEALQVELGSEYFVSLGMCYGNPDIGNAMKALNEKGCERMIVLPLYPQYSATTTAAVWDVVNSQMGRQRNLPEVNFVRDYHLHPGYISALAQSIDQYWKDNGRGQRLMMSFHGIPQRNADLGDPYPQQCQATADALAHKLGLNDNAWGMTYQSRFGRAAWLQPYTSQTLEEWARAGIQNVDVICPGFSADCLETLEEIKVENAEIFKSAGGGQLNYIPALNERSSHISALASLIRHHSLGWTTAYPN